MNSRIPFALAFALTAAACGDDTTSPADDTGVDASADAGTDAIGGDAISTDAISTDATDDAESDATTDTTDDATPDAADTTLDVDPTADRDNDGLTDLDEITIWGTSPIVADTDGDGFSDKQEVVDLAFDPEVNNFQFNPLVADRPMLDIELAAAPVIYATYTTASGTTESIGQERSSETREANSRSWGGGNSYAVEQSHTVGVSVGFDGWKMTGSVSYEYSYSTTNESSSEWSEAQSTENASTLASMRSFEETNEIASSGGVLGITVTISNPGDIAYFIENLTLSAYELDPLNPEIANPVGTLVYLDGEEIFPRSRLEPGEESAPLSFAVELDVPTVQALLAESRNLMIAPGTSLIEGDGTVNFELASTAINARTAEIIIDYGFDRPMETYRVSTVANEDRNYITADEALSDILRIPYAEGTLPLRRVLGADPVDTLPMLTQVRDFASNDEESVVWTVIHNYPINNGADVQTDQYHPFSDSLDFGALQLQKGHTLQLVRIRDADLDGLGERAEYAYGTDPNNPDTDADGCNDGFEVAGWTVDDGGTERFYRSNPTLPNSDFDVLNDCEEFEAGTDPMSLGNTKPTIEITVIPDGAAAEFEIAYDDVDTEVLEIRYTIDDGPELTIDVEGVPSPVSVTEVFDSGGPHTFSAVSFDGQLLSDVATATHSVAPTYDGLVHYWPITGSTDDVFYGELNASRGSYELRAERVRFVTDRFGSGRGAAYVDPSEGHGLLQTAGHIVLGPELTMSAWARFSGINGTDIAFGQFGTIAVGVDESGIAAYDTRTNGYPSSDRRLARVEVSTNEDVYRHIAVTLGDVDGAQIVTLYVDGVAHGSGSLGTTPATADCEFALGQPANGELTCDEMDPAEAHEGGQHAAYDDVRLYNRALSPNEILGLYLEEHD